MRNQYLASAPRSNGDGDNTSVTSSIIDQANLSQLNMDQISESPFPAQLVDAVLKERHHASIVLSIVDQHNLSQRNEDQLNEDSNLADFVMTYLNEVSHDASDLEDSIQVDEDQDSMGNTAQIHNANTDSRADSSAYAEEALPHYREPDRDGHRNARIRRHRDRDVANRFPR